MSKYTAKDIEYLANCLLGSKIAPAKPYAALIGAGVSKSAGIPTAPELVAEINKEAAFSVHLHGLSVADCENYGLCMAALTLEDRRRLLDPKLDGAKVNWASLALAALMKENLLRRVLSFDFDNVLLRACGICAHYPAVYDFSMNPPSEFSYLKPGAITHLHGQGSRLVMLNPKKETEDHAEKLEAIFRDTLEAGEERGPLPAEL